MVKLRKFCSYRSLENPYTRKSKFKSKAFIKAVPTCKVTHFVMGTPQKKFESHLELVSKTTLQIRHNALESARMAANRILETTLGKGSYHFVVSVYPHHVLRENPLASGAGADRMSTGMQQAFGKTIGIAARVKSGQPVFTLEVDKNNLPLARNALKQASFKLPNSYAIRLC